MTTASTRLNSLLICALLCVGYGFARAADPGHQTILFEEKFAGKLADGWTWYHEVRGRWKVDAERKTLAIQPSGGWMPALNNVPMRDAPDVSKEDRVAVEVHIEHAAKADYEFAGLMWYFDDKNFVVIRKGPHGDDGRSVALLELKDGKGVWIKSTPYEAPGVDVRMVVTTSEIEAWYRPKSSDKWQLIGKTQIPEKQAAKIGLRTGNGEGDKPTWAEFSSLRVIKLGGD